MKLTKPAQAMELRSLSLVFDGPVAGGRGPVEPGVSVMHGVWKTVLLLAGIAVPVAALRYFAKGWLEPIGIPTVVGSFVASLTVVLLIGLGLLFWREGRAESGRYFRAAAAYGVLAAWCETLVILGILAGQGSEASTYYSGPWEAVHRAFPTARQHVIGHAQGFLPRLAIALVLGAVVYAWGRRGRRTRS